jgi:uncharacterized membrane protein
MSRIAILVASTILLLSLAAGLWALAQVGADRVVAVHWNAAGRQDGFAPAPVAFVLTPVVGAAVLALLVLLPSITPRGENLNRSAAAYGVICVATASVVALAQAAIVGIALGYPVNVAGAAPAVIGAAFVVIGNILPKLRWNYVAGIRTPWTLADARVWDKTHRFGGWVMVAGGLVLLAAGLIPPYVAKIGLVAGVSGAIVLLTFLKSYLLWREQSPRRPSAPPPARETR